MPLTADQVIEFIDQRLRCYVIPDRIDEHNGVGAARAYRLRSIREYLRTKGFPASRDDRCRLSLLPFVHQELIYSDIKYWEQSADLENCCGGELKNLADLLAVDFYVFSGGLLRSEALPADFARYLVDFDKCCERWKAGEFKFWLD